MLGRYRSIYHFHIPKCGGTSVFWWLARHASDRRPFCRLFSNRAEEFRPHQSIETLRERERAQQPMRRQAFYGADVVSTHAPLRNAANEDATFKFTVLRRPAARVISQIGDWRRLQPHDLAPLAPHVAEVVTAAQSAPLTDFLVEYGERLDIVSNYIARTLAELSLTPEECRRTPLDELVDVAIEALETKLDFVGISERFPTTMSRLADLLGLAPERDGPRMNANETYGALADEAEEAKQTLDAITVCDRRVYEHALALFLRRDAGAGDAYDRAAFEKHHAAAVIRQLEGCALDGDVVFSVREPILGCGFHGRDGSGMPGCCVWSGPSSSFVLYMPVPDGVRLDVKIWVRGYADLEQRKNLRVEVDGNPTPHRFEPASGYAEVLVAEARAQRSFLSLEIDIGETTTTGEPGTTTHDPRRRGLAFDRYGWRALPD